MTNKHQIQKDFYKKKEEWKQSLRAEANEEKVRREIERRQKEINSELERREMTKDGQKILDSQR